MINVFKKGKKATPVNLDWEPTEEQVKKLSGEEAKFILEQAEKLLKELSDASSQIVARTFTLISVSIGLLVALVGYGYNRLSTQYYYDSQSVASIAGAVYLFLLCVFMASIIRPKEYRSSGALPEALLTDLHLDHDEAFASGLTHFYVVEIVNYNVKIKHNNESNEERWTYFNASLFMLILTPVVMLIAAMLFSLL